MILRATISIGALLLALPPLSVAAEQSATDQWTPRQGDHIVIDTDTSTVYLVAANGNYLAVDGLTGQRRTVHYDGITYYAATPERTWEIRELDRKGRSVTFGEGRFLRLSWPDHIDTRTGNESTAYGIHSHRSFARMLEEKKDKTGYDTLGTGWRSMGCILVSEEDLTVIERMWEANDGVMTVETRRGVDPDALGGRDIADASMPPSWLGWLLGG